MSVRPPTVKMCPIIGRVPSRHRPHTRPIQSPPTPAILWRSLPDTPPSRSTTIALLVWFSSPQGAPHRGDDPVLRRLVEIGVHGQADHLFRQPVAHRHAALGHGETAIRLLPVHPAPPVNPARHAFRPD